MTTSVRPSTNPLPSAQRSRPAAAPAPAKPAAAPAAPSRSSGALGPGATDRDYGQPDPGIGARGPVRQLQADLAALGYFSSVHGTTGGFFKATTAAVKAYQHDLGLKETGRAC